MNIEIFETDQTNYAPAKPVSVFDINQLSINVLRIENEGRVHETEVSLTEWLGTLRTVLCGSKPRLSCRSDITGDEFSFALIQGKLEIMFWDRIKKAKSTALLSGDSAVMLFNALYEYLRKIAEDSGVRLSALEGHEQISLPVQRHGSVSVT